ncbi:MAG: Dabb family protein [Rhodobacteraceae bacterium]|nr:Dabb family protein [Paracoccaceae bacterium]
MIRHIVLIRFRTDLPEAMVAGLLAPLGALSQRLGFAVTWGRSESPEQIERGYLHGFVADFADWQALATYQDDPAHKAFGAGHLAFSPNATES